MAATVPLRRAEDPQPSRNQVPDGSQVWLARLGLRDFRNYGSGELECDGRPVVLVGPNGAGKTNLLEAVSLLTPGRGLRGAKLQDLARNDGAGGWALSYRLRHGEDETRLSIALANDKGALGDKRSVRIDGAKSPAGGLRDLVAVQWLTPRMDRLFIAGRSERLRFMDRLVYGIDRAHARRIAAYESAMRERTRLLERGGGDDKWLGALEARMVSEGIAIAAARHSAAKRLTLALGARVGPFPNAEIAVCGELEESLETQPAVDVEAGFAARLCAGRARDGAAGRALDGPHRADLAVTHSDSGAAAEDCSTGQQKALLIAIVLANAHLAAAEQDAPPLILLDEVTAHLDRRHREALFDEICAFSGQVWLAGTDRAFFDGLDGRAQFVAVAQAELAVEELRP